MAAQVSGTLLAFGAVQLLQSAHTFAGAEPQIMGNHGDSFLQHHFLAVQRTACSVWGGMAHAVTYHVVSVAQL